MTGRRQDVEGLGEEGGEVIVLGVHDDPPPAASAPPEVARSIAVRSEEVEGPSDLEGQPEPEPEQGLAAVLALGAPSEASATIPVGR